MAMNRRGFLLASLATMAAGCASDSGLSTQQILNRPDPVYPRNPHARSTGQVEVVRAGSYAPPPRHATPSAPAATAASAGGSTPRAINGVVAIGRESWAKGQPSAGRLNKMGRVDRITVHHEGSPTVVTFTDVDATKARLEAIRKYHADRNGWGDIGYHYVVDRAGRLWEARQVMYQGAHVRDHNEHNLGIMVLGNFERQTPTEVQLATLAGTVQALRRQYRVPVSSVKSHREWSATSCPGKYLQPSFSAMRSNGSFA